MNKEQLLKLAALDNPKTNEFLEDFAASEKQKILVLKTNEEILEHLNLVDVIFHKAPEMTFDIVFNLIYERKPISVKVKKTPIGNIEGVSYQEVIVKCLEIIKKARYQDLDKSIKVAFDLTKSEDNNVSSNALKLIEEIVEYNYQAIPVIGITAQLKAIQFIENELNTIQLQKDNLSFIKIVLNHLLETSSKTMFMSAPDALTFSSGDISGHPNIQKIRRRAINLAFDLFRSIDSIEDKKSLFVLFEQACRMPMHSPLDSELSNIIQEDREYVLGQLDTLVFAGDSIVLPLSICLQIEHLLYWYFVHQQLQVELAQSFIDKLHLNSRYELFNRFVHDDSLRYANPDYYGTSRDVILNYIKDISDTNKQSILIQLEDIAKEAQGVDEWKFLGFKQLLEKLSELKPALGFDYICESIENKSSLSETYFLPFLLAGLRRTKRFDLWDKCLSLIIKSQNIELVTSLVGSVFMSHTHETDIVVRKKEDIKFLSDLIKRVGDFEFYKQETSNNLICYFTINALRVSYPFDPKRVEKLIILEIKNNPSYFLGYVQNLTTNYKEGGFYLSNWSKTGKGFLVKKLIEVNDIDWHIQWILPALCEDAKGVISFFIKRIDLDAKKKISTEDYYTSKERFYDPVPYHMSPELVTFVTGNETFNNGVDLIIKNLSLNYGIKSMEISQLIRNFNVNLRDIFERISGTEKTVDNTLKKLLGSLSSFDQNDPDFLIELAGKTSSKSIHSTIFGKLSSTGVVSGEFGIADAYRGKRIAIEKYKDSDNENVRQFVSMATEWLTASEDRARKDAQKEKEMRRIEFESSN